MAPLSVCMKAASTFPKTAKEALRALGAAAQHRGFGLVLLKTQGVVSWAYCLSLTLLRLEFEMQCLSRCKVPPTPATVPAERGHCSPLCR